GTVCMASRTGRMTDSSRRENAAATPSGIPMTRQMKTAMAINASVCMVSSQRPTIPGYTEARAATAAGHQRRVRAIRRKVAPGTTYQGSHCRKPSTEVSAQSILRLRGVKKDVNRGWVRRFDLAQAWKALMGSEITVSHALGNGSPG